MSASREKNKRKEQIASGETPAAPEKKGMSKGLKWTIGIICLVFWPVTRPRRLSADTS